MRSTALVVEATRARLASELGTGTMKFPHVVREFHGQYPIASPSLRGSLPPWRAPVRASIVIPCACPASSFQSPQLPRTASPMKAAASRMSSSSFGAFGCIDELARLLYRGNEVGVLQCP